MGPEWALIISLSVKHSIEQFDVIFLFLRNLFQKYLWMTCKSRHRRLNGWWRDHQRVNMIRMVIPRLMMFQYLRMTPITPCWPHLEWLPDLLSLVVDFLREIPTWQSLLQAGRLSSIFSQRERLFQGAAEEVPRTAWRSSLYVCRGKRSIFCWCHQRNSSPPRALFHRSQIS